MQNAESIDGVHAVGLRLKQAWSGTDLRPVLLQSDGALHAGRVAADLGETLSLTPILCEAESLALAQRIGWGGSHPMRQVAGEHAQPRLVVIRGLEKLAHARQLEIWSIVARRTLERGLGEMHPDARILIIQESDALPIAFSLAVRLQEGGVLRETDPRQVERLIEPSVVSALSQMDAMITKLESFGLSPKEWDAMAAELRFATIGEGGRRWHIPDSIIPPHERLSTKTTQDLEQNNSRANGTRAPQGKSLESPSRLTGDEDLISGTPALSQKKEVAVRTKKENTQRQIKATAKRKGR